MIAIAALMLQPVAIEQNADEAMAEAEAMIADEHAAALADAEAYIEADNQQISLEYIKYPEFVDWRECVLIGADSLSHGHDASDLVARAAVRLCRGKETIFVNRIAQTDPDNYGAAGEVLALRAELQEEALAQSVHHRAINARIAAEE